MTKAETLLGKLSGEQDRWESQVGELQAERTSLAMQMVVAAGFNTYLAKRPEDVRSLVLEDWCSNVCRLDGGGGGRGESSTFNYRRMMSTESEQLRWKAEGLPSGE